MEVFGIILSIPETFLASLFYRLLLIEASSRFRWLNTLFIPESYVVFALLAAELILLMLFGALRSRALVGPIFVVTHAIVFYLGTPALANLLILRRISSATARWYVAVPLCTVLGFFLVLLEFYVSEQLYGIDQSGGPYS